MIGYYVFFEDEEDDVCWVLWDDPVDPAEDSVLGWVVEVEVDDAVLDLVEDGGVEVEVDVDDAVFDLGWLFVWVLVWVFDDDEDDEEDEDEEADEAALGLFGWLAGVFVWAFEFEVDDCSLLVLVP